MGRTTPPCLTSTTSLFYNPEFDARISQYITVCAYQHGGPEVELLPELGDEDVHADQVLGVVLLHLTDDVRHPLKLLLGTRDPQEVHLQKES